MKPWASWLLCVSLVAIGCEKHSDTSAGPALVDDAGGRAQRLQSDGGGAIASDPAELQRQRPERIVVDRVALRVVPSLDRGGKKGGRDRRLTELTAELLVTTGQFVSDAEAVPGTHRARHAVIEILISHDRSVDERRRSIARISVESRVVWADGRADPAPRENVAVERLVGAGEAKPMAELLADVVSRVVVSLSAKEAVRSGGTEALAAGLAPERLDLDSQLWALEVVRDNRRADGYDGSVGLLGSKSAAVRAAAVGALLALGDPRAMKEIARATDTKDTSSVLLSIEAAATLGGDEAHSYLEFLIEGHASRRVLDAARKALARITPPGR